MSTVRDLYEVLGIAREATDDDIKKAYRRLARELHPDVNADPRSEERFKEVAGAYEILSDPHKRRQYDAFGSTGGPGVGGFTDIQDKGPFKSWKHTHFFEEGAAEIEGLRSESKIKLHQRGTWVRDVVEYTMPMGAAGALAHQLFARRQLESMFAHRRRRMREVLGVGETQAISV